MAHNFIPTYAEIVDLAMTIPIPGIPGIDGTRAASATPQVYKPRLPLIDLGSIHECFDARQLARHLANYTHLSETFSRTRAIRFVSAMLIHTCYAARLASRRATLCDLHAAIAHPAAESQATARKYLRHLANGFDHNPHKNSAWKNHAGEPTETHPYVAFVLAEILALDRTAFTTTNRAAQFIALDGARACGPRTTIEKAA